MLHVCSVLALGMATVSKASAVMLPPMLALYIWCVTPRPRLRRALFGLIPLAGVVGAFFAFDALIPKQIFPAAMPLYHHVLTATSAFGFYMRLLLVPVGLCAHHMFLMVTHPTAPQLLGALPWALAVLGATAFAFRRSRTAFFGLAWLLIASAPMSSLVFVGRPIGEQRAYAPSVGLCVVLAFLLLRLPSLATGATVRRSLEKLAVALCAMLVVTYAGLTTTRNMDWSSEFSLWLDTVQKNPVSDSAQGCLARMYYDFAKSADAEGDWQEADRHRRKAKEHLEALLEITPGDVWALDQLAVLCDEMGLHDDAIEAYERLLGFSPGNAAAHLGLAIAYARSGRRAEAIPWFERACRIAPDYAEAYYNFGIFHNRAGDYSKAIPLLERAAALEPGYWPHRRALGEAYEHTGRYDEALAEYEASLAIRPENPDMWLGTGYCHEALGDTEEAMRRYRRCLEVGGPVAAVARERLRRLTAE
jgi:tetratricopeptide (TPR) repeat protein